jgi:hypothetical protein
MNTFYIGNKKSNITKSIGNKTSNITKSRKLLNKLYSEPINKISEYENNENILINNEQIKTIIDNININFNINFQLNINNIDFEKYLKILSLKHKLITNAFSSAKLCNDCEIKKNLQEKYQTDINNIKLPDYEYIKCLADHVKNDIDAKSEETQFIKNIFTGSQYRFNNYVQSSHYFNLVSIFFNLFFNDKACILTNNYTRKDHIEKKSNITINIYNPPIFKYNGEKIEYDDRIFNIILNKECNDKYILCNLDIPEHANSLIFDIENKCIYHFEPNGYSMLVANNNILLKDWFIGNGTYLEKIINYYINDQPIIDLKKQSSNITIDNIQYDITYNITYNKTEPNNDIQNILNINNIDINNIDIKNIQNIYNIDIKNKKNITETIKQRTNTKIINKNIYIYNYNYNNYVNIEKIIIPLLEIQFSDITLNYDNKKITTKPFLCEKLLYLLFKEKLPEYTFYPAICTVRPDTMIINYSIQSGFDPDGYCQTINYFYLFMMLYNNNLKYGPTLNMAKWITQYNYEIAANNENINASKSNNTEYDEVDQGRNFVRYLVIIFYQYLYKYIALVLKEFKTFDINNYEINDSNGNNILIQENESLIKALLTHTKIENENKNNIEDKLKSIQKINYHIIDNDNTIKIKIYSEKEEEEEELTLDNTNYWNKNIININDVIFEYSRWILLANIYNINTLPDKENVNNFNKEFIKSHYQISDIEQNNITIHGTRFRKALNECKLTEKNFEDIFKIENKYKQKYLKYKKKYLLLKN